MKPNSSLKKSLTKAPAEQVVKDIRRQTRRHFSAEDKIRIVLEGLRGEDSIAELCRKEGIAQSLYYTWSKEFIEAGKRHLAGDTARAATSGEGLDKLRILATIAREWGQENYQRKFAKGRGSLSNLDDVLIRLHVRACQVVLEIITLLENGLADGAMARWRTLHEITTVVMLIHKHGEDLATRYVHYQIVESKKALNAYEQCREALGFRPYSKKEAAKITKDYGRMIAKYGTPFGCEYGWAADLLGKGPKKRVTFADMEEAAGIQEMRSYYRMASYNVHASSKGVYFKLGQMEQSTVLLAGASNAGLVEPAQNGALSLAKLTMLVCNDKDAPPFDNLVFLKVVNRLMWEIPRDFGRADRLLKSDHKRTLRRQLTGSIPRALKGA